MYRVNPRTSLRAFCPLTRAPSTVAALSSSTLKKKGNLGLGGCLSVGVSRCSVFTRDSFVYSAIVH